jgi:hypothetical protein
MGEMKEIEEDNDFLFFIDFFFSIFLCLRLKPICVSQSGILGFLKFCLKKTEEKENK